jgi:hypothetical protein
MHLNTESHPGGAPDIPARTRGSRFNPCMLRS